MQKNFHPISSRKVALPFIALTLFTGYLAQAQTTPFPLGAFVNTPNGSDPSAEANFESVYNSFGQLMGSTPKFLDYYVDQSKPVDQWPSNAGWSAWSAARSPASKVMPVIGFPMASTASSLSINQQYQAFTSGQYDSYIQQVVQQWQENGFLTQYWRIGWEMNLQSGSMPWYGGTDAITEADWVAAYRHIATVLRQAGSTYGVTIEVIWNPGVTNYDNTNTLALLYPGNDYVDIIGADIYADSWPYSLYDWDKNDGTLDSSYNQWLADSVNRIHYWTYPAATQYALDGSQGHDLNLQSLLDFAKSQGKPFAIPETGAGNSQGGHDVSDEAAFPLWLASTLKASGNVIAFVNIWDANADGNFLFSNSAAGKPGEAAAWAQGFGVSTTSISTTSWYTAIDQNSGKCVDVSGGSSADGANIIQWSCGKQKSNQEWQFLPTDSGYYTVASRNTPGSVLDVVNGGTDNRTKVQLWHNVTDTQQQWMPVPLGSGFYKLVGRSSGRCLDVPNNTTDEVQLQIYDCNGTSAQAWKLIVQP